MNSLYNCLISLHGCADASYWFIMTMSLLLTCLLLGVIYGLFLEVEAVRRLKGQVAPNLGQWSLAHVQMQQMLLWVYSALTFMALYVIILLHYYGVTLYETTVYLEIPASWSVLVGLIFAQLFYLFSRAEWLSRELAYRVSMLHAQQFHQISYHDSSTLCAKYNLAVFPIKLCETMIRANPTTFTVFDLDEAIEKTRRYALLNQELDNVALQLAYMGKAFEPKKQSLC